MDNEKSYFLELISLIESGEILSKKDFEEAKIRLCKKHCLKRMPSNPTVLSFAKKKTDLLLSFLRVKPTRSLSGIAVIAIMPPPSKCPGKCIYCPGSLLPETKTPKSYTGKEPATMRAIAENFSAEKQIKSRLKQLEEAGHGTGKIELVIMGGTFLASPIAQQKKFVLSAINAASNSNAVSLEKAGKIAENAKTRITGITFETRPDYCGKKEISRMLSFGGTRCELGVQTIYDSVYRRIRRGHSIADVINATALLKDSAFKVCYHLMPGLPGVSVQEEKKAFKEIFSNPCFKPDNLKIYPCLVIEGTKLFDEWKKGDYKELSIEKAVKIVSYAKSIAPRWLRIMRIQRDIPAQLISAGVQKSNLRQIVQEEMKRHGKKCHCIRCREAGLRSRFPEAENPIENSKMSVEKYDASNGKEFFISLEDRKKECLFGFARLRIPASPFRKEILPSTAIVRELRVFGLPLPLHERKNDSIQHKGLGKELLKKAEEIALEFDSKKLLVISGLGVKPYYYSLGFKEDGFFVSKQLQPKRFK